ncbi:MAG: glycosyltransferase family 4 protein [Rhodospirillales bacterium]
MGRIILADDGISFDGKTFETKPLGGVESAVVCLAEALARRGHDVTVCNRCEAPLDHNGVAWRPIHVGRPYGGVPEDADLYIANRGDKLIPLVPKARRAVFWVHNPARYLLKWRYLSKLWRRRPAIVFIGAYHAATYPRWAPGGGRIVIPYGIPDAFRTAPPADSVPGPRAVFTSNPLRSLDWLLDIWAGGIYPHVPGAELHVFAGASVYGSAGDAKATQMDTVLNKAQEMRRHGVIVRGPVPKRQLIDELRAARVMLYRGDINETFCLALGEAQAMGVPAVVQDIGSVSERVIDGSTGYVAATDEAFSGAAIDLLTDDGLWRTQHDAALDRQRRWSWDDAAAAFEKVSP